MFIFRMFRGDSVLGSRNVICSRLTSKNFEEQQCTIKSKALAKLGIPAPPKRPSPSFAKFMSMTFPTVKQQHPHLSAQEATKVVVQEWSRCDPEKKRTLREQYLTEMEDYLKKKTLYEESLTPEQHQLIHDTVKKEKRSKQNLKMNKKKKSLGKPKAPPGPYIRFLLDCKVDWMRDKKWNFKEFVGQVSEKWKNLSEHEKQKYTDQWQEESKKYHSDLLVWEGMMVRQGHTDLVRKQVLIDSKSADKKEPKEKN